MKTMKNAGKKKTRIIGFRPDHDVGRLLKRAERTTGWTRSKILNAAMRMNLAMYAKKRETTL